MATATSTFALREPLPPLSYWGNLRYRDATMNIHGGIVFVSDDDVDGGTDEQEVELLMAFDVLSHTTTPPSVIHQWDRRLAQVYLPPSQMISVRGHLPGAIFVRPDLEDVYGEFLINFADLFTRTQQRDFSTRYGRTPRTVSMQLAVNVVINETETPADPSPPPPPRSAPVPQLEKVAYVEGGAAVGVSETACPICLQDFETGEEVGITPCGHPFHPVCLGRWLEQKPFCPLCRSQVPLPTDPDDASDD